MHIEFSGKILFWQGPAPWFFVTVPEKESQDLKAISAIVTYGWGVIPVQVRIGKTEWVTSLFPKDGLCTLCPSKQVSAKQKTWRKATR